MVIPAIAPPDSLVLLEVAVAGEYDELPGLTSPAGRLFSDGNGCPGANMYCESDASCFWVANETDEFYIK